LITRWLAAVSVWWACRELWPRHNRQAATIAILFSVYPGFIQQQISIVYSHYFLVYAVFAFSLGAMVRAIRKKSWLWWLLSLFSTVYSMLSIQYFVGLEIARPLIIGYLLSDLNGPRKILILDWVKKWMPYLGILIVLVLWRFFFLPTSNYEAELLPRALQSPFEIAGALFGVILNDSVETSFVAWLRTINLLNLIDFQSQIKQQYSGVVILAALVVYIFLIKTTLGSSLRDRHPLGEGQSFGKSASILGALMVFGAGWPFWIVPFEIELRFPWDRFTLPMMLGASILLSGLMELLTRSNRKKTILLALMVGFAAGYHFKIANTYKLEWLDQERFLWQLSWRIPSLKPGTAILTDEFPYPYTDDQATTTLINFMYGDGEDRFELPYGFFELSESVGTDIPILADGNKISANYGPIRFEGSTSQALVIYYSSYECLQVLNPTDHDLGQKYPGILSEVVPLSDTSNILRDETVNTHTLTKWFGPLANRGWCYYYEKAELARQFEDWEDIVYFGQNAFGRGIQYFNPQELFPFIEGYAIADNIDVAKDFTNEVLMSSRIHRPQLCQIWGRVVDHVEGDADRQRAAAVVLKELGCDTLFNR